MTPQVFYPWLKALSRYAIYYNLAAADLPVLKVNSWGILIQVSHIRFHLLIYFYLIKHFHILPLEIVYVLQTVTALISYTWT